MTLSIELTAIFSRDLERVAQEVAAFPSDEALWQTKSGVTNSAGNLALHLEGNIREYIGPQIGGIAYQRERPFEFSATATATDPRYRAARRKGAVRLSLTLNPQILARPKSLAQHVLTNLPRPRLRQRLGLKLNDSR